MDFTITIFLIAITAIISIMAFRNRVMFDKLKFNPYMVSEKKDYGRLFTHALIHADWMHLIINMYVLYSFGRVVESTFADTRFFPNTYFFGKFLYVLMYLVAVPIATIPALIKHKKSHAYNSVGASGAVSAVVFASIIIAPDSSIGIIFIPISIPSSIFGLLYLAYSFYMSKRSQGNIAHDAHFIGAVFGLIFPLILNPNLFMYFINSVF